MELGQKLIEVVGIVVVVVVVVVGFVVIMLKLFHLVEICTLTSTL